MAWVFWANLICVTSLRPGEISTPVGESRRESTRIVATSVARDRRVANVDETLSDVLGHIQDMTSDKVHEQSWPKWDSPSLTLIIETLRACNKTPAATPIPLRRYAARQFAERDMLVGLVTSSTPISYGEAWELWRHATSLNCHPFSRFRLGQKRSAPLSETFPSSAVWSWSFRPTQC